MRVEKNGWSASIIKNKDGSRLFTVKRGRGAMPEEIAEVCDKAGKHIKHGMQNESPVLREKPKKYARRKK